MLLNSHTNEGNSDHSYGEPSWLLGSHTHTHTHTHTHIRVSHQRATGEWGNLILLPMLCPCGAWCVCGMRGVRCQVSWIGVGGLTHSLAAQDTDPTPDSVQRTNLDPLSLSSLLSTFLLFSRVSSSYTGKRSLTYFTFLFPSLSCCVFMRWTARPLHTGS